jgi:hypothetical protein
VAACDPADGHCTEAPRPPGAPCDPKNSCISDAVCDAQGVCMGTPAANGDPCTATTGQIGQCVSGACVASTTSTPPPPQPKPDAGPDAPVTHVDATATTPTAAPQKSGCAVAGGPGATGGTSGPGAWTLLALLGAALVVRGHARRR